ncbi:cob(I)yrinic acid a,c-diamide adenosyltransferase [Maribellus sediminis]|uniref:cob(I)yrinic acid a,c-diamide adenosyltransferase n=1 Tax=Maribellus sediminis TaxID=2696285 RepID=UPI0014304308|nr:cob(I)yrinic acid a,c-diamide adenosyltransferase [Maribellus sediminis]
MAKEIKIYTKTGDDGTTGLVGGSRVKKYDLRLEAYGTVDELNAAVGVIRSYEVEDDIKELLLNIQNKLFNIGSRLASDEKGEAFTADLAIKIEDIAVLEDAIDRLEEELPKLKNFILPGGDIVVAQCHVARTVCRRAERRIVEFSETEKVQPDLIKYINRLSDFFFVLARITGFRRGVDETHWKY